VRPGFQATRDRRIGPTVLFDGTPEGILDGCAALDDAGD